jgi:dTDP-glucose 4,6-dehydratase
MKKILITGGAGFIGHHIVEHLLRNTDWQIVLLDRLSVSGNYNRFRDIECWEQEKHRVQLVAHDLRSAINSIVAHDIGQVDYILHMAASTHVDRSIEDPMGFVLDNVVGTTNLLQFARQQTNLKAFLYFSTDEVFGPAPVEVNYQEWARYNSGNPYAAAKAGGEEMALAFANTYRLPVIITHTMNVFGERQHPEKFIPLVIKKILTGQPVLIHSNKAKTKAGSRYWIHARNVAAAVCFLLERWETDHDRDNIAFPRPSFWRPEYADKFNIVGEREVDNLEMAQLIDKFVAEWMDEKQLPHAMLRYEMTDFHSSRPGHDLRYALDGAKMKALGWSLPVDFEHSLRAMVRWTLENKKWLAM